MNKLRIGIIGAGSRGVSSFGKLFSDRTDTEVVAYADLNEERMKEAKDFLKKDDIELYTDVSKMLSSAEMDAVVIATIDCYHKEHIVAALEAGYHVLTDKPMATNTRDCIAINDAARKSSKIINMGFNIRSDVVCRKMKELIETGVIGKLVTIEEREYYTGGKTYFSRWNRFYAKCGGLFCHKGSHDFDIINWFNEGALPVKVSAFAGMNVFIPEGLPFELEANEKAGPYCEICQVAYKCPDRVDLSEGFKGFTGKGREADGYNRDTCMYLSEKDTHDNGIALIEYDNGVRVSHSENFISPVTDRFFSIVGDKGHIEASLGQSKITVFPRWTADKTEYFLRRTAGGHGGADPRMVETFVQSIRHNKKPTATVRDGTLSVLIADAAERSRRENRTVMIDELISRAEIDELI
ncbi:MAG: Gfo/Idh/MocA family oxidoreductase [Lentisphaerae bacterium]|nr:Gfo/Idh/MocA family oxidoreductase [Lentisphaerota bacterium]